MATRYSPTHRAESIKRKSWCAYCAGAATAGLLTVGPLVFPATASAATGETPQPDAATATATSQVKVAAAEEPEPKPEPKPAPEPEPTPDPTPEPEPTPTPEPEPEKAPEPEPEPEPKPEAESTATPEVTVEETPKKAPKKARAEVAPTADEDNPLTVTLDDHVVAPGATVVGTIGNLDPDAPVSVEVMTEAGATVVLCQVDAAEAGFSCDLPTTVVPGGNYLVVASQGTWSATAQLVVAANDSQTRPLVDASDAMQFSDITLTGVGWDPDTTVNITLTGPNGETITRNDVSVDGDGAWALTIPTNSNTTPGDWSVFVKSTTDTQATAWLTVEVYEARPRMQCTRKIILTTETTNQTVNLRGFTPDGTEAVITLTSPTGAVSTYTAVPEGEDGTATVTMPVTANLGRWTVNASQTTATSDTNADSCTFTVVALPDIDPPTDPEDPEDPNNPNDPETPPIDPPTDDPEDPKNPTPPENDDPTPPEDPPPPVFDPTDDETTGSVPNFSDEPYTTQPLPEAEQTQTRIQTPDDDETDVSEEATDAGPAWRTVENRTTAADADEDSSAIASPWLWALGATGGLGVAGWWLVGAWRRNQGDIEA